MMSKTAPSRSQLTQSAFLSQLYDIEDRIGALVPDANLQSEVEELASELNQLAEECRDNRSNMPDSLQDSDTGNMLEERADACESAAQELESIDFGEWAQDGEKTNDNDEPVNDEDETEEEYWQAKLEEVQNVSIDV